MNIKTVSRFAVLCVSLSAMTAHSQVGAEERYGALPISRLIEFWNSGDVGKFSIAYGYILGTLDGMTKESPVCIPPPAKLSEVFKRVVQETEPAKRNVEQAGYRADSLPASVIVEATLRRAFPCNPKK